MKRLTSMLLALGALATGCYSNHCDYTNLNVYWTFTGNTGVAGQTCAQAGVTQVRIYIDGQPYNGPGTSPTLNCDPYGTGVEGVTLTNFTAGSYQFQIEGYDAGGTLRYLEQQTVSVQSCGTQRVDFALAATTAPLQINYQLPNGGACPANSYVWMSLTDVTANSVYYAVGSGSANPQAVPCGTVLSFPDAPLGDVFRLDWIQVVRLGSSGFAADFQSCTPQTVTHLQSGDGISAFLSPATTFCQ